MDATRLLKIQNGGQVGLKCPAVLNLSRVGAEGGQPAAPRSLVDASGPGGRHRLPPVATCAQICERNHGIGQPGPNAHMPKLLATVFGFSCPVSGFWHRFLHANNSLNP